MDKSKRQNAKFVLCTNLFIISFDSFYIDSLYNMVELKKIDMLKSTVCLSTLDYLLFG